MWQLNAMRPARAIPLALAAALVALLAWLVVSRQPEPVYNGKPLSAWIDGRTFIVWSANSGLPVPWSGGTNSSIVGVMNFGTTGPNSPGFPRYLSVGSDSDEARGAVTAIGTNSLPFLVKWIQARPHPWTYRTLPLLAKLPPRLRGTAFAQDVLGDRQYRRVNGVVWCFQVLVHDAAPAVPALTRLLNDRSRPAVAARAMEALSCIGKDGTASLLAGLTNPAFPYRAVAAKYLCSSEGLDKDSARPVVPVLLQCLKDPDHDLGYYAGCLLGDLGADPDTVVTALMEALRDPSHELRAGAEIGLVRCGAAARPALLEAANGSDAELRSTAERLLKQVATNEP